MQKNKFKIKTDEALYYLDALESIRINALINFFKDLKEFKQYNEEYSRYKKELNCLFARSYNCDPNFKVKGQPQFKEFAEKHFVVLNYLYHHAFYSDNGIHIRALIDIFGAYVRDDYSDFYINNVIAFLNYVKANHSELERIHDVVLRISQANVRYIEMGNADFKRDGHAFINFHYREKPQSAFNTLCTFTNGKITNTFGGGNAYDLTYKDADYKIYLTIDPVLKRSFDLNQNQGFYREKLNGTNFTSQAKDISNIFDSVERTMYVDNLLFEPEDIPVPFMLKNTLYKVLPEVQDKIEYNKNLYECEQLLKELAYYVDAYDINENNIAQLEIINNHSRKNLLQTYMELRMRMAQLGYRRYSHVKLIKKDNKK